MYNPVDNNMLDQYNKLLALNSSLANRLQDCELLVKCREEEIELLHSMLSSSGAHQSNTDEQVETLQLLQHQLQQLQLQVASTSHNAGANIIQLADTGSAIKQFADLRQKFAYVQTQLTDLQEALADVNSRNILLQQQNSRIAELESLLENSYDEISALRSNNAIPR